MKKKTWIWIIVGIGVFGVLMLFAVAGAGVYFVTKHIETKRTSGAATRSTSRPPLGRPHHDTSPFLRAGSSVMQVPFHEVCAMSVECTTRGRVPLAPPVQGAAKECGTKRHAIRGPGSP